MNIQFLYLLRSSMRIDQLLLFIALVFLQAVYTSNLTIGTFHFMQLIQLNLTTIILLYGLPVPSFELEIMLSFILWQVTTLHPLIRLRFHLLSQGHLFSHMVLKIIEVIYWIVREWLLGAIILWNQKNRADCCHF